MELKILLEEENKLFNRIELRFEVIHEGEPTPKLSAVRSKIALTTGGMSSHVVIDKFETLFGIGRTIGYARVYKTKDEMLEYEPEYLLKRNGLIAEEKQEEKQEEKKEEKQEEKKEEKQEEKKEEKQEEKKEEKQEEKKEVEVSGKEEEGVKEEGKEEKKEQEAK